MAHTNHKPPLLLLLHMSLPLTITHLVEQLHEHKTVEHQRVLQAMIAHHCRSSSSCSSTVTSCLCQCHPQWSQQEAHHTQLQHCLAKD
jgi:hypothetical protein